MALTKSSSVVHSNITLTASAGNTTSSDQVLTGVYQCIARIRFTNGGTGPTIAAQTNVMISEDTTSGDYMSLAIVDGGTTGSAVSEYVIYIPDSALHLQFVSGSNTGQNVT